MTLRNAFVYYFVSLSLLRYPDKFHRTNSIDSLCRRLSNLDRGLAESLAVKERQECVLGRLDALKLGSTSLDGALGNPLGHDLPELVNVVGVDVVVPEDEALDGDAPAEDLCEVGHAELLRRRLVVLRHHSTHDNAAEPLHVGQGGLEVVAADVLVDDVHALGREPLERGVTALLGVVEALVRAERLDVLGLLVRADAADDTHPLLLGQLHDDLAHCGRGGVDPDGLPLLGLDEAVEGVPGCLTRQAEGADPVAQVDVVLVVNLPDHVCSHGLVLDEL